MSKFRRNFLSGTAVLVLSVPFFYGNASAEDCTGLLPTADCTLDEDTTAPLTIDGGIKLSIGSSVLIGHEIDADDLVGEGEIETFGIGNLIVQTAPIGGATPIGKITIADDNTWTTSSALNTDNSGGDIDLDAGGGGETLNFTAGGSYSGEIDGHFADTVNFGSDGNGGSFTTGGQIETVRVIVTSGSLNVNNALGGGASLAELTIADGASVVAGANITTGGALDLDGSLTVNPGNTVSADTYTTDADSGAFILEVSRTDGVTEAGRFSVSNGGPVDLSNDILEVRVGSSTEGLINETIAGIVGGNTAATVAPGQFIDESFLYNFALQPNGDNFDLLITVNPLEGLSDSRNNLTVARTVLSALAASAVPDLKEVQALLGRASTSSEYNKILESLQPAVDRGFIEASMAMKENLNAPVTRRIGTLLEQEFVPPTTKKLVSGSKDLVTGRVLRESSETGTDFQETKGTVWGSVLGARATQSERDSINAYDMTTSGVAFGADTGEISNDMLLGIAAVIGVSDIDADNANNTRSEIDSYGLSMYAGSVVRGDMLLRGSVSYMHNENKTTRRNVGTIAGISYFSDYSTEHLGLNAALSKKFSYGRSLSVLPEIILSYDFIEVEEYNEAGNSDLGLSVDYESVSKASLGAGLGIDYLLETDAGIDLRPSARIDYRYNVLNDEVRAAASFRVAPGETFILEGFDPPKNELRIGSKLQARITEDLNFSLGYDFQFREDYHSHAGQADLVYSF